MAPPDTASTFLFSSRDASRLLAVYGTVGMVESLPPTIPKAPNREVDLSLCASITIIIGAMIPERSPERTQDTTLAKVTKADDVIPRK